MSRRKKNADRTATTTALPAPPSPLARQLRDAYPLLTYPAKQRLWLRAITALSEAGRAELRAWLARRLEKENEVKSG